LDNKEDHLKNIGQDIENVQDKIEKIKFEINDLPRNPEAYNVKLQKVLLQNFDWTNYSDSISFIFSLLYFNFLFSFLKVSMLMEISFKAFLMLRLLTKLGMKDLEGAFNSVCISRIGVFDSYVWGNKSIANYSKVALLSLSPLFLMLF
jgi:hypothetical protein